LACIEVDAFARRVDRQIARIELTCSQVVRSHPSTRFINILTAAYADKLEKATRRTPILMRGFDIAFAKFRLSISARSASQSEAT